MGQIYNFCCSFFIKTKHSHSPADCPFSDNFDVISDTCVQASIHETIYNVMKVCTDLLKVVISGKYKNLNKITKI